MILDTNALIWAVTLDDRLGKRAAKLISETQDVRVSVVSLYEITIKERLRQFQYFERMLSELPVLGISIMPVSMDQLRKYASLTDVELKDPFDLAIIALALASGQPLITSDRAIHKLPQIGLQLIDARK